MSFILAQRDQKARISNYADMISNAVMTVFVIVVAHVVGVTSLSSMVFYYNRPSLRSAVTSSIEKSESDSPTIARSLPSNSDSPASCFLPAF